MKKVITFLLIIICLLIFVLPTSAHPGRTDSSGGHYNHSTGEYHYHCGGHPEHQHTNGVCPYDSTAKNQENDDPNYILWIMGGAAAIGVGYCLWNKHSTAENRH